MIKGKKDIRQLSKEQLENLAIEMGEKPFRGRQIFEWLWKKSATDLEEMTNLSVKFREKLSENYEIRAITLSDEQKSSDGTIKAAFKLHDGHYVEGVLIPADNRMTACISSQVGCSLSCKFCATGYMDRKRNIEAGEIYDQVVHIKNLAEKHYDMPLTNIVYMGMGEPLLNYKNMLRSTELITTEGLGMSPKRITVSTAGIEKMIRKLGEDNVKFNLALSLHAANDGKRDTIMPINETNKLEKLSEALVDFCRKTQTKVTLEYIIFDGVNDGIEDAKELLQFSARFPCKVNIIEYNPISEASFKKAEDDRIDRFAAFLEERGMNVNVRRSRGKDIDAACGQLANKKTA